MASDIPGFNRSYTAGGTAGSAGSDMSVAVTLNSIALPAYQYMAVRFNSGLVVPITATSQIPIGVILNKPAPGQPATVAISGVVKMHSDDSSITIGTPVYVDQYGFANSTVVSGKCIGMSEEVAATATGYVISVLLKPLGAMA